MKLHPEIYKGTKRPGTQMHTSTSKVTTAPPVARLYLIDDSVLRLDRMRLD